LPGLEVVQAPRAIFRRYAELKSVQDLKQALDGAGIVSKMRLCANTVLAALSQNAGNSERIRAIVNSKIDAI
jgi:hypothetical protein